MFGLPVDRLDTNRNIHKCDLEVNDGDIVYITGPSGAGKSVLLREIQNNIPPDERISIDDIALPDDRAVIDCIPAGTTIEALRLLGYAGLSDVFCVLTPPANLSEGQKYRFRLACALAQCSGVPEAGIAGKPYIFADEFCSNLDRITAAVIAYNVRRFAKRGGATFFLASSHEDILADLQPDVLVVKHFTGPAEVTYKAVARRSIKTSH
jgi:ABC-type ATPase with predicted acetyltransferase domain